MLLRSIESVLDVTSGSHMHLVISVRDPTTEILRLLRKYPVSLHITRSSTGLLHLSASKTSILRGFKHIFGIPHGNEVCVRDNIRPEIKVLHTTSNFTETSTSRPILQDMYKLTRGVPFMENTYSPIFRKAILNDQREHHEFSDLSVECNENSELKETLEYVLDSFPSSQHMILLAAGYTLSPDFVR